MTPEFATLGYLKAFGPKVSGLRASGTFHVLEDVAK